MNEKKVLTFEDYNSYKFANYEAKARFEKTTEVDKRFTPKRGIEYNNGLE